MKSNTVVELEGVNGEMFNLTTGDKGVYLATDVKGAFFDPPVKCVYEEPGNYSGARYLNHRILRRDIVFGVEILNDAVSGPTSWLSRDSLWRKAWAYDRDCKLYVTTDSGTRYLKLRLLESPEVDMQYDPHMSPINRTVMTCVAGDPFWYEDDEVFTASTTGSSGTLNINVPQCNPTDQYIFPKWSLPGSTLEPSEPYVPGLPWLGAPTSPQVKWTVPDYSFEDPTYATRRIVMPGLIGGLRTDEIQAYNLDGIIQGGTYTLSLNGSATPALPWDATTGQVKGALEALAAVAYDDVEVTRGERTREVQIVEIHGATGGTFTLSFGGQTTAAIPYNSSSTEVEAKLKALSSIGLFDCQVRSKISNEVQLITLTGEPTDGTFTLTWDGYTTDPINFNATALTVESKLGALPGINPGDITVYKEWFRKYAPWKVTFGAGLLSRFKGVDVPTISGDPEGLEGGAGMDVVVTVENEGGRPYEVRFNGARKGQNVPEMVINTAGLTKGDPDGPTPWGLVTTSTVGGYPYIVRFRNGCSGISYDPIVVNTGGLTGYGGIGYRSWKITEGYTAPAENCFVDVDPRVEQVVSESGSNLWARMNGVRFKHAIPPYTGSKTFSVSYTGATAGQMVALRLPRPWSRPWGLE